MVIVPTIGAQLRQDTLIAILISMAGIILYISARFEMRFGVAAALAMTHDVLIVLGLFYLAHVTPEPYISFDTTPILLDTVSSPAFLARKNTSIRIA